ncbi:MAG TPA: hypothetical protein VHC42_00060, partial [Rhizomicrobium sp.]|nr:hypothetical protein [Rhizomicrobium sp.]
HCVKPYAAAGKQAASRANPNRVMTVRSSLISLFNCTPGEAVLQSIRDLTIDRRPLTRAPLAPFVKRETRMVCARLNQRGQTC